MDGQAIVQVGEAGCGYIDIQLATTPSCREPYTLTGMFGAGLPPWSNYPAGRSRETAAVSRLQPGERRQHTELRLEAALEKTSVEVRVVHREGEPGVSASVRAFDDSGSISEFARADAEQVAEIPCLRGLRYELEAQTLPPRRPSGRRASSPVLECRLSATIRVARSSSLSTTQRRFDLLLPQRPHGVNPARPPRRHKTRTQGSHH